MKFFPRIVAFRNVASSSPSGNESARYFIFGSIVLVLVDVGILKLVCCRNGLGIAKHSSADDPPVALPGGMSSIWDEPAENVNTEDDIQRQAKTDEVVRIIRELFFTFVNEARKVQDEEDKTTLQA
ncbi:uncharacterized protein LOC118439533 isoform X2 [Folsomia candida]|uniref:uncharacterized protein LOC118439533 isoform X2 n=1 Tax=Folsomia candida TaxID=158441 RepID=UPI0016055ACF|nr:uncharacterized protein LOC118439533 isoform X2 [Folsomia candida]